MKTNITFCAVALLVASSVSAPAAVHYVDLNSTNATPPYSDWTTAATNIQDAVDAAVAGDEVVVTNGTYYPVGVGKPLNIRSVSGPQFTVIDGSLGYSRCVYLADAASLSGFTLANGFLDGNDPFYGDGGAGALGGTLTNCTLRNNLASYDPSGYVASGGGAADCTLNNCTLTDNWAINSFYQYDEAIGGGAYQCTLNNCMLSGNRAAVGNNYPISLSSGVGGGAASCTLNNCTLSGNSADQGGGAYGCTLNNCIVFYNTNGGNCSGSSLLNCCCTLPLPNSGFGNITNAPRFVDAASGNLRLQSNSPCINAGNNAYAPAGPDLDGNPRISGDTVDIGAYEFQSPASMISYAWLQHFNLPINSSTDTADPDGDGVDNYHEWLAGSDPTNPFSSPAQLTIIPFGANIILTWSTNAAGFTLQSSTNLVSPAIWSTNSPTPVVVNGQNTVTNPIVGSQRFYRLIH